MKTRRFKCVSDREFGIRLGHPNHNDYTIHHWDSINGEELELYNKNNSTFLLHKDNFFLYLAANMPADYILLKDHFIEINVINYNDYWAKLNS